MNITIADTLWGVWEYKSGPFDEFMKTAERKFGTQAGGFTILNRELANPATFHKDLIDTSKNLSSDVIGLFRDGPGDEVPSYENLGTCMVRLADGNYQAGILELTSSEYDGWGYNVSVFARYLFDGQGEKNLGDDLLTIEYFGSLSEAQAGFTDEAIIYQRFLGFGINGNELLYIIIGSTGLAVIIITIAVGIVFVRKKKNIIV